MRFYYLDTKYLHGKLNENEMKEYVTLQTERSKTSAAVLIAELKKSNEDMKDLAIHYKDSCGTETRKIKCRITTGNQSSK